MAESAIEIDKDNEHPSSISDEVPGEQKIREMDITDSSIVTDEDTLSPVITITKKETTLTKGDLKLQKVTVTEDISTQETSNSLLIHSEQTDKHTNEQTIMSGEHTDITEESREERKSKIPLLKFKQTVEKVNKERKNQQTQAKTQNLPRRSSIPKLKDPKIVNRTSSLKQESYAKHVAKLEDEFERIYKEIKEHKQKEIDEKILAIKIDDPEKIETKFEEIINAYDSKDDNYLTQTEKLKLSKTPWRKKEDAKSKIGLFIDKAKSKNSTANTSLRDGGLRVSASDITTKRFSRGHSTELRDTQTADVVQNINIQNDNDIKEIIVTERTENIPIRTKVISDSIITEPSVGDANNAKETEIINKSNKDCATDQKVFKNEITEGKLIKMSIIRQNIRTGIPIKTERININISKELNKRPPSLSDRDLVNKEVTKREEISEARNKTIIISQRSPTDKFTRSISRTYTRDGKSVTMASKSKENITKDTKLITNETTTSNDDNSNAATVELIKEPQEEIKKGTQTTETIAKESIKTGIPVYTKLTQSYAKGKIQNVEITKTIEWKQAEAVRAKNYVRTYSENKINKTDNTDKQFAPTIIKREEFVDTKGSNIEIKNTDNVTDIAKIIQNNKDSEATKSTDITPPNKIVVTDSIKLINTNDIANVKDDTSQELKEKENNDSTVQEKERNIENVTVLKGNVSRIITKKDEIEKIDIIKTNIEYNIQNLVDNEAIKSTTINLPNKLVVTDSISTDFKLNVNDDPSQEIKEKEYNDAPMQDKERYIENITVLKGNVSRRITQLKEKENQITNKDEIKYTGIVKTNNQKNIQNLDTVATKSIDPPNKMVIADSIKLMNTLNIPTVTDDISQGVEEKENKNITVQDKKINNENVTVLKGIVSRKINQITVKENQEAKKEIDVEKDLPKKKSVLSKIALYEGIEPAKFSIKKCVIGKKTPSVSANTNDVDLKTAHIVHKTQPKLDLNVDIDKTGSFVKAGVRNTPIIVDQIWKFDTENSETIQQVESITNVPAAIDLTVIDRIETTTTSKRHLDIDENKKTLKFSTTLPGKIGSLIKEKEVEEIIPARIDFISNENQDNIVKFSPEKVEYKNRQDSVEEKKVRVGKLNLTLWQRQVEVNKQFVGKGKPVDNLPEILPRNVDFDKNIKESGTKKKIPDKIKIKTENEHQVATILPGKVEIKSGNQYEIPTILPEKIKSNIPQPIPVIIPSKIDLDSKEKLLKVPVVLPETPLTKRSQMDFETQIPKLKTPVPLSDNIDLSPDDNNVQTPLAFPEAINFPKINDARNNQILTGQMFSKVQYLTTSAKMQPSKIEYNPNENKIATPITSPEKLEFKKAITPTPLSERIDFKINDNNAENRNPLEVKTEDKIDNRSDREVPSDPELVDSESEIKEMNDTIMGKLKSTIFFSNSQTSLYTEKEVNTRDNAPNFNDITVQNQVFEIENPINTHLTGVQTNTTKKELNTNDNEVQNIESTINRHVISHSLTTEDYTIENTSNIFDITTQNINYTIERTYNDFDTKSDIYTERSISREDLKRTKSPAELDLGDLVKGQVKRMVFRIKSVDNDRPETPKAKKISVKEMPKRSTVLEKIALFEGKSSTSRLGKRTIETTTVTSTSSSRSSVNETRPTSEQIYLQKVEDLATAKIHYGKMDMLYLKLANDVQMPVIALGTANMDPNLTSHIVSAAIDLGYRAIDTAYVYGNEKEVGQAIKTKLDDGSVRREDLYIMSKLWSTFHHPQLVETACRASLEALGLDYFDLYMIQNPMSFKEGGDPIPKIATVLQFSDYDYLDAWFAMEKLVSKGLVRSIGVSNFNSQQIQRVLTKGRIRPVVNQVECHPYLSQQRLQAFCSERNITLSCFAVLGSKGTPTEYKSGVPAVIDDPFIQVMASGLNITTAQLLVRYQIQSGRNVVVKASSASHLWAILQALTFQLEQHHIDALNALNRNKRIFTFKGMGDTHKNYPFREPF